MSAKQGINKWSLMIMNTYCCQIHSILHITDELKANGLIVVLINAVMWNQYVDCRSSAVGHTYGI